MNYFSDYLQTLGNDFEIAATEFDLIIVKENSELILMGMMELYLFIWGFTSLSTLYRSYHDG